ncbi:3'-5' exonuclease [Phototrophicus methaneseepsis]|uniref:3'-5' exonuclease n=1 Tax=Phototrophicus methaneseepsis TaxID=2710758 RepID=A0A7S8E870_9CHLR|nr:3'-5' exonuclease [Phototrophicus methaneseepsis]QPC82130.1 3'-5' exonuclease [Phototrophicus methaneseepsis]
MQQPETKIVFRKTITAGYPYYGDGTWTLQTTGLQWDEHGYPIAPDVEIIAPDSDLLSDIGEVIAEGKQVDAWVTLNNFYLAFQDEVQYMARHWAREIAVIQLAHAQPDLPSWNTGKIRFWLVEVTEAYRFIMSDFQLNRDGITEDDLVAVDRLLDDLRAEWRYQRTPQPSGEEVPFEADLWQREKQDDIDALEDDEPEEGSFEHAQQARAGAIAWAKKLLARDAGFVVIDLETTGLDRDAEIVQIGVLSSTGAALMNTLVKPTKPIPAAASKVHGITDDMVADAPGFADIYADLRKHIWGQTWVIFNAQFDAGVIDQVCKMHGLNRIDRLNEECAMLQYAAYRGEWNDYFGNWRWPKLAYAIQQFDIDLGDGNQHNALTDCRTTLALVKAIAAADQPAQEAASS